MSGVKGTTKDHHIMDLRYDQKGDMVRYTVEQRDTFHVVDEGSTRKWAQKHCTERNKEHD